MNPPGDEIGVILCHVHPLDGNHSTSDDLNKTFYQIFYQLTGKHERPSFFLAVLINYHRYTETFAYRLAETLHSLCDSTTKVAFMCCPTAFVAFQHRKRLENAMLLEYDQRFAVLSPKQFIPYDLDEPDIFPESLKSSIELAVVDPPFLNEVNHASFSSKHFADFLSRSPIARSFKRSVKFSIQPRERSFL